MRSAGRIVRAGSVAGRKILLAAGQLAPALRSQRRIWQKIWLLKHTLSGFPTLSKARIVVPTFVRWTWLERNVGSRLRCRLRCSKGRSDDFCLVSLLAERFDYRLH